MIRFMYSVSDGYSLCTWNSFFCSLTLRDKSIASSRGLMFVSYIGINVVG
jgi:hypothetical protein